MWRVVSEHEIQALRRIYAAISRWDLDELIADVAHDIEWTLPDSPPWGGTRHGHRGIGSFATSFRDHVVGTWADPDDYLDPGDRIVVLGRFRGRAQASGQQFEFGFAHVWALTDGMASRMSSYFDTAPVLAALEGRPAPESSADI
jgi:ketosteroid isomerase-like protein